MADPIAISGAQECTICLETVSNPEYFSSCCNCYLCSECFDLTSQLVGLFSQSKDSAESKDSNLPTCNFCGFLIQPTDVKAAITSLITTTTTELTTKITADLDRVKYNTKLVRANLAASYDNIAELQTELIGGVIGAGRSHVKSSQLADLIAQLEDFVTSETKSYQLELDQLLNLDKLLSSRLRGLANPKLNILTLAETWAKWRFDFYHYEYSRFVWWRRASQLPSPFQLIRVSDYQNHGPAAIPIIQEVVVRGGSINDQPIINKFARLLDDALATVRVSTPTDKIVVGATALVNNHDDWRLGQGYDLILEVDNLQQHRPLGCGLGVLRPAGYYFYYWVKDTLGRLVLMVHDFKYLEVAQSTNDYQHQQYRGKPISHVKTHQVTLSASVGPEQVYRYHGDHDTLIMTVEGRLVVVRLAGDLDSDHGHHDVKTSKMQDLTITRIDQDQLWLNWDNREVRRYQVSDLINCLTEDSIGSPLERHLYLGPTDHRGYIEVVVPGNIAYCNYKQVMIYNGVGFQSCYQGSYSAVDLAEDGTLCLLTTRVGNGD